MDSTLAVAEYQAAVRAGAGHALQRLPSAEGRDADESDVDASDRRAVHQMPLLRLTQAHGLLTQGMPSGEPQACEALDGGDGARGDLPKTSHNEAGARKQKVPIFASRAGNTASWPCLVRRHNLHSSASRVRLPGGRHGLVQPVRALVAAVELDGDILLPRCPPGGSGALRSARHRWWRNGRATLSQMDAVW